ncbi:COG3313 Predicted Fe-S protein [uncultured Caudovirales phage]|uniref:COG3313 Predicted Fe-S protein n=1 Tax=uncultured Caudovirales phage TaxID=2100421 RepID=A0A6J5NNZ1_9CAUD|nr:COG3313 Predicted Fe-S protein [uncultured Caudovirales phage]
MTVPSPCVNVCKVKKLSNDTKVCLGCYRKVVDIAAWMHYTDDEKLKALKTAEFYELALTADKSELL